MDETPLKEEEINNCKKKRKGGRKSLQEERKGKKTLQEEQGEGK